MSRSDAGLAVGVVGCGLIGHKRSAVLGEDRLVGCFDVDADRTRELASAHEGAVACANLDELLGLGPDVVIAAVSHDQLRSVAVAALEAGAHVLVEKPCGIGVADVDAIDAASRSVGRQVKVGFNHRYHPAIAQCLETAHSGRFGDVMFARARYGHGGRIGYENEWRADPAVGGGGELTDQGMHLLDLFHALLGELPLHSALLRTNYWDMVVEDNAVVTLGAPGDPQAPWATFHVSWSEWKNLFSLEVYCRTGKLQIDGLQGSYGPQRLTVYAMKPELGPPDVETFPFDTTDVSWEREWDVVRAAARGETELHDLAGARWCWSIVEQAYEHEGYPR